MKYRILNKLNEKCYEDFGCCSTKEEANLKKTFINMLIGYPLDNIEIVEES